MSIILQALAKNQDRLIPDNPTKITTEATQAKAPRRPRRGTLPDITPIWEDTRSRAEQAAAAPPHPPCGLSEIKISWVLIIVAMGCMFGMLAAFYPPSRVDARIAAQQQVAPAAADVTADDVQVAAATATEEPAELDLASASAAEPAAESSMEQALEPVYAPTPPEADAASPVVRVIFRKEGGQTEPDGTYRQEYAEPATEPLQEEEPAPALSSDEALSIPGMVPIEPADAGVPEISYEDDTLYEAAPIPTATREAPDAPKSRFKSKTRGSSGKSAEAKPEPAALRVEGIFWDRTRPMALINGDIVEVGSRVREGQVVDIQPGSVTVDIKGVKTVMMP